MQGILIKRQSELSIARQIYQALREQMTDGRLAPGEALPSTRELAKALEISRNTAYEAYEMLSAEGYVMSHPGSPTRVANGLRLEKTASIAKPSEETRSSASSYLVNFRSGQPDLSQFPRHAWLRLLEKAATQLPDKQWGYTGPDGFQALREEIAAWLFRSRGLNVPADDIFITSGATQALHLLTDLIIGKDREILVEDPCHIGMLRVLQRKGCPIRPVPVDRYGIQTHDLDAHGADAIYVTPSHQFPLGGILPADRRAALIRIARNHNLFIIEDDYDSEFRYAGPPVAPLFSMDPDRVIYVGTFSKILFPALRIGYIILPPPLQKDWRYLRTHADVQNPPFDQAALAEYLNSRKLDRHVQQMRRLYGQKRDALLKALKETFKIPWQVWGDAAGLHLVLEFPGLSINDEFASRCKRAGIYLTPLENHCIRESGHGDKLILGYGHLEFEEIKMGIRLLYEFICNYSSE